MAQRHTTTGPCKGQPAPDDGRRRNWPKRCVKTNTQDGDESPTNSSIHNTNTSSQSLRKTITDRYGPETATNWRKWEKLNIKLARERNHLTFMCRCRDNNIIPAGLNIKLPVKTKQGKLIAERTSRALVRERVAFHRRRKADLEKSISDIEATIRSQVTSAQDFDRILKSVRRSHDKEDEEMKKTHKQKLEKLKSRTITKPTHQPIKAVVNLSEKQLTKHEEEILNKGLNFATSTKRINSMDIVAPIEETAMQTR